MSFLRYSIFSMKTKKVFEKVRGNVHSTLAGDRERERNRGRGMEGAS